MAWTHFCLGKGERVWQFCLPSSSSPIHPLFGLDSRTLVFIPLKALKHAVVEAAAALSLSYSYHHEESQAFPFLISSSTVSRERIGNSEAGHECLNDVCGYCSTVVNLPDLLEVGGHLDASSTHIPCRPGDLNTRRSMRA